MLSLGQHLWAASWIVTPHMLLPAALKWGVVCHWVPVEGHGV